MDGEIPGQARAMPGEGEGGGLESNPVFAVDRAGGKTDVRLQEGE